MSGLDLHPEALLDREAKGELSAEERLHLDAHLAQCATCRLERQLRADFAAEAYAPQTLGNMQSLVSSALLAAHSEQANQGPEIGRPAVRRRFAGQRMALALAATMLFASGLAFAQTEFAMRVVELARSAVGLTPVSTTESTPAQPKRGRHVPREATAPVAVNSAAQPSVAAEEIANALPEPPPGASVPEVAQAPEPSQHETPSEAQVTLTEPAKARRPRSVTVPAITTPAPHAQGSEPGLTLADAEQGAAELFDDAARARREGRTDEALNLYAQLNRRYPQSPESLAALVVSARIELDRGNLSVALTRYETYLRTGARSLREQALVGKAQTLRRMGRLSEEAENVQKLRDEYPDAPYAKLSEERIEAQKP